MKKYMLLKFVLGREENMDKGENAGYQHFLLFPECFQNAFSADDKIIVIQDHKFVLGRVENIMGKGENAVFKSLFFRVVKSCDCVVKS